MSSASPRPPGPDVLPWLIGITLGGIVVIVGLIAILLMLVASTATGGSPSDEAEDTQTSTWERPDPVCGDPCLTIDDALALEAPDASLAILGVSRTAGATPSGTQQSWESDAVGAFYLADGDPQACVFAMTTAPLAPQSQSVGWLDDPVADLGGAQGNGISVTQVALAYQQNLDAGRYPGSLRSVIARCPAFTMTEGDAPIDVTVTPLDLDLGVSGVESVAWTETWPDHTETVVDVRYGTLVIRTVVALAPGASATPEDVREFVVDTAQRLASS